MAVITFDLEKQKLLDTMMGKNREMLDFLIQSEAELEHFQTTFLPKSNKKFAAIMEYRLYRQTLHMLPFEPFRLYFNVRPHDALKALFQQPISDRELRLLNKRLEDGTLTLESLYKQHLKYPEYLLSMFVL